MRRWLWVLLVALAGPTEIARASSGADAIASEDRRVLQTIQAARAEHPDDPDLAWAEARTWASVGDPERALREGRAYFSRWPGHRPNGRVELARLLLDAKSPEFAMPLLDEAIAVSPRAGIARFYRALAFRATGALESADREFRLAGRLSPSLRAESLLLRALGLFERGRSEEAVELLLELLRTDPTGDPAIRARLLLRRQEWRPSASVHRLSAHVGFEWDDNVTLESAENEVPASDREDFRGVWGLSASSRVLDGERLSLTLGYRYDQTEYDDLDAFRLLSNTVYGSLGWRATDALAFRLDVVGFDTLQDLEQALGGALVRPSVLRSLGPTWGVVRLFSEFEIAEYDDRPALEAFEQDAWSFGVGVEHVLPLRDGRSWIAVSGSWARTLTDAEPSGMGDGFDGDFDYDRLRARAIARIALPFRDMRLEIDGAYTHDRYHNDNLAHAITTVGGIRERQDDVASGRIGLSLPVLPHTRVEAYWRGQRRISNVDVFDYDKQVTGLLVHVSTD